MGAGFVKFCNLCDKVEMLEGSPTTEFGAMEMGIPQEPQVVDEGV